jgi:hypothetical protein
VEKNFQMWTVNENLLQSYRSAFMVSQSLMLATGAIFWGKSLALLCVVGVISFGIIWGGWVPIVLARHKIVDYYKHSLSLSETQQVRLCTESEYVKDARLRNVANEMFGLSGNLGQTRIKLDLVVPASFSLAWVIFVVTAWR